MAESSFKNEQSQEYSHSGSFTLAEGSVELENPPERTQAEENDRQSWRRRVMEKIAARKSSELTSRPESELLTRPITYLDPWNSKHFSLDSVKKFGFPRMSKKMRKTVLEKFEHRTVDAWQLREKCPDYVPVTLEKDSRSDIPDIEMKKYHVPGDMPLGEFARFIGIHVRHGSTKPIFVFFKNTEPPTGALMSAVDEENKDEDGFLHITYSGEENVCGSNEEQECSQVEVTNV